MVSEGWGLLLATSGDFSWPPVGTSTGHQWGLSHGHGQTFGAVVLIAGIFALPAVLVAAIGQTGSSPLPESWWDVAWIVGALIVAAAVAWAVTRFSGAAIADVLGSKPGGAQRAATTTRHTGWPPLSQRTTEVPSEPTVRAEAQPADAIAISSLALLLAARLEVALGPEFQVVAGRIRALNRGRL